MSDAYFRRAADLVEEALALIDRAADLCSGGDACLEAEDWQDLAQARAALSRLDHRMDSLARLRDALAHAGH